MLVWTLLSISGRSSEVIDAISVLPQPQIGAVNPGEDRLPDLVARTNSLNNPPQVEVVGDMTIGNTTLALLSGLVWDDRLPSPAALTSWWSQVDGPGSVSINNGTLTASTTRTGAYDSTAIALFPQGGSYRLALHASDSEFETSREMRVTVVPGNQPPIVEAGSNQVVMIPDPALLSLDGSHPTNEHALLAVSMLSVDRWNPSIGQPGLTGPDNYAYAPSVNQYGLTMFGTNLYVASSFSHAGGVKVDGLGRWDGTQWSTPYDPSPRDTNDPASLPLREPSAGSGHR